MEDKTKKTVTVRVNGVPMQATVGSRLSELIGIDQPCGGRGTCGKCRVTVNGREELACRYTVESDVDVQADAPSEILSESGTEESGRLTEHLCLALDVGTTTLALSLISLDEGQVVRTVTATNPQRAFGADVITRIDYCQRHSVEPLHLALIGEINRMIASLKIADADTLYAAGNATMLHTLFGIDPSPIGVAPYTAAFLDGKEIDASELGLLGVRRVISLPSIASFVGADIVAGLHRIGPPKGEKYNLLIDLGTNAEVVLYSARGGLATAAAAGPCFEGASISCGMSATEGAITAFTSVNGIPHCQTVGGLPPRGICGTGLVDVIATLLELEIIDETGYMEEDYPICEGVYLSPEDVRQYQLAKSAICSAILSLMRIEGIGFDEIETMYIAGGFSARINLPNAVRAGLIPRALADRAVSLLNTALQGTVKYACEGGDLTRFTKRIRYVDLSADAGFSNLFMENMMFS